mmetsp:Transcript_104776/g.127964  ORF Transcript_104776/g.127964 Transcript_104776/m.127964 type:complete len:676 (-) Transcript_104776:33-2060(-)
MILIVVYPFSIEILFQTPFNELLRGSFYLIQHIDPITSIPNLKRYHKDIEDIKWKNGLIIPCIRHYGSLKKKFGKKCANKTVVKMLQRIMFEFEDIPLESKIYSLSKNKFIIITSFDRKDEFIEALNSLCKINITVLRPSDYNPTSTTDENSDDDDMDMDMDDDERMQRLEDKIKKKRQFDREYDAGLLTRESMYDNNMDPSIENKHKKNKKNQVRKVQPGKGDYFMDIQRQEMAKQEEINIEEFVNEPNNVRNELQGFMPGTYVEVIIDDIPCEFDIHFDLEYPLIIGGLLSQECQYGFLKCKIKKHRWGKRLLKFNDPLIVSLGWRRYQTIPLYCMEDRNQKRLRLIKYTPENMHCFCIFYGPIMQPNTGFIAYQSCNPDIKSFRISATGTVLSNNLSYKIVKKLKLIGEPFEIHKNTCFVRGMFNSNVEVSKFIGAKIQTVSGIRGSIKKNEGKKGAFRATFEDKLLMSDIIFLKTWIPIKPIKFYHIVKSLLLNDKSSWKGMRTVGEMRNEMRLNNINDNDNNKKTFKEDSIYQRHNDNLYRKAKRFNPLVVPLKLQKELPYQLRPKYKREIESDESKKIKPFVYKTAKDKMIEKFVNDIAFIASNHNSNMQQQKLKKRKRKRKRAKEFKMENNAKKRKRQKAVLTGKNKTDSWEATRGNKFHKEWRLHKK